jgi:hypothetical protein
MAAQAGKSYRYQGTEVYVIGTGNSRLKQRGASVDRSFYETVVVERAGKQCFLRRGQLVRKTARGQHIVILGFAVFVDKVRPAGCCCLITRLAPFPSLQPVKASRCTTPPSTTTHQRSAESYFFCFLIVP